MDQDIKAVQKLLRDRLDADRGARAKVARELGVHRSHLTNALSDGASPKPETLHAIAQCLGLEVRIVVLPDPNAVEVPVTRKEDAHG